MRWQWVERHTLRREILKKDSPIFRIYRFLEFLFFSSTVNKGRKLTIFALMIENYSSLNSAGLRGQESLFQSLVEQRKLNIGIMIIGEDLRERIEYSR